MVTGRAALDDEATRGRVPDVGLPTAGVARGLEAHEEERLLWRLRTRLVVTSLRQLLSASQFRLGLAVVLTAVFWSGLFLLTFEGFAFLDSIGALSRHIDFIFELFYSSLLVMLLFSSAIILYGGLYGTRESTFLLSTPIRARTIFLYKFQEAMWLSCWGFILLDSPLSVAYGIVVHAPWYYYVLLLPYILAFVMIPAGIGAIICLLVVRYLTRFRKQTMLVLFLLVCATAFVFGWAVISGGESNLLTRGWFEELSRRFGGARNRLLPSWWLTSGMMESARNDGRSLEYQPWAQALLFLALLVSNALMIRQVALFIAGRVLRDSYNRLHTTGSDARRAAVATVDRLLDVACRPLRHTTRLLLLKDFRIFRRDPAQWTQFLILFALVMLYFLSVQRINYEKQYAVWVNVVSFLNLAVVGLILSTFTTRFIFPMISLEGRRFWLLGLLPVARDTILWGKFLFATVGSLVPSTLLVLLSDVMLHISPMVILIHEIACVLLCVGLSAIAVGLGAVMPDLRETNPSKIAAGFGGTLNLVLSALYVVLVVALTAIPCYRYVAASQSLVATMAVHRLRWTLYGGCAAALVLGAAATAIPMWIGLRAFRRLEF